MKRLAIAAALLALLATASVASAKAPVLEDLHVYRDTAGAGRGSLVIVGDADFTKAVAGARNRVDPSGKAVLTVELHGSGHDLTVHDSARLTRSHHLGVPVRFHITIPAADAKVLGRAKLIRVSAWLDRVGPASARRAPSSRGWRQQLCESLQSPEGLPVPCPFLIQTVPNPPAPPVGFEVWQGGTGDSLWEGASEALVCVSFNGTNGYEYPTWYSIGINTPTSSVGYTWPPSNPGAMDIPASGTSTETSYYDTWPTGYANVVTGPSLTVTIPTSVLSSPVSSSTGSATLVASPGFPGTSGTWTLGALPASAAAGVC
jgi:hypothetical protein